VGQATFSESPVEVVVPLERSTIRKLIGNQIGHASSNCAEQPRGRFGGVVVQRNSSPLTARSTACPCGRAEIERRPYGDRNSFSSRRERRNAHEPVARGERQEGLSRPGPSP